MDDIALNDYVATANSGKYTDPTVLRGKFPEFEGVDQQVLDDYVATSNSGKYKTSEELNSKFPELTVAGDSDPKVPASYMPAKQDFSKWNVTDGVFKDEKGDIVLENDVPAEYMDQYQAHLKKNDGNPSSFFEYVIMDTKGDSEDLSVETAIQKHKLLGSDRKKVKDKNVTTIEQYKIDLAKVNKFKSQVNDIKTNFNNKFKQTISPGNNSMMIDPNSGEGGGNVNGGFAQSNNTLPIEKLQAEEILRQNNAENRGVIESSVNDSRVKRIYSEIIENIKSKKNTIAKENGEVVGGEDPSEDEIWEMVAEQMTIEDSQAHFKKSVNLELENNQALLELIKPESQVKSIKETSVFLETLPVKVKSNIANLNHSKTQIENIDLKIAKFEKDYAENVEPIQALNKSKFEANKLKIEKLGEVNENSSADLIGQWNVLNDERTSIIKEQEKFSKDNKQMFANFDKTLENRKTWVQNYTNHYKLDHKFREDGSDAVEYMKLLKRNNHNAVAASTWALTAGVSLLSGIESAVYNIKELPEDLMFEFYDNDFSKMPPIVQALKAKDEFVDAIRFAGKEKVNNFITSMNASVQEATEFENIEDVSDFGAFALHGLANFAPQVALMAATGGASIYVMGASAFGGKFDEMDRSNVFGGTEYSLGEKWLASTIVGASEVLSEKVTFDIFKGLSAPVMARVKEVGFMTAMKNFSVKGTLAAGGTMAMETTSEGFAQIGGNIADKYVLQKNISLFDGVSGAMVTGLLMERSMSMPAVYGKLAPAFMGKDYQEKLVSLNQKQKDFGNKIMDPNTSASAREKYETEWLKIQENKETIMAENVDGINTMTNAEKDNLINIENSIHDLKSTEDAINADDTMSEVEKEELINETRRQELDLLTEKYKFLAPFESPETKAFKLKKYKKDLKVINEKLEKLNKGKKQEDRVELLEIENDTEMQEYVLQDQALKREEIRLGMEVINDPAATSMQKKQAQEAIDLAKESLNHYKQVDNSYGFIDRNGVQEQTGLSKARIIINKEAALMKDGNINVAAHEFLHNSLFQTIKGDSKVQSAMGDALLNHIKGKTQDFSAFRAKMQPYGNASNLGEEVITVMSESIMDGTLEFNDGFFTKIGDLIRQNLQRFGIPGFKNIKFNTGKDVYNFIKDYNASIEKGYDSKALDKMAREGAKGKLTQNVKATESSPQQSLKSGFENDIIVEDLGLKDETAKIVARNKVIEKKILEEGLKDDQGNIRASTSNANALVTNNLPRAFALARKAANKGNDLTLEEGLRMDDVGDWFSEYSNKLIELSRTYRARKGGKEVPFGAYMNALLPLKYSGILDKMKSKVETSSMSNEVTAKKVAKKTNNKTAVVEKMEGKAIALETIGHDDIMPKLRDVYSKNKEKVKRQKTYKDVKTAIIAKKGKQPIGPYYQALVEVASIFEGIDSVELAKRILIKQDLTASMRKIIQDKILRHTPEMINMVPDGTTASGDATGIANTSLGTAWYDKKGRTKMADTGTGKGLPAQQKQGLNTKTFLTPFGLGEKGKRVVNKSVDGALREWVTQITAIAMNQASRQQAEIDSDLASIISTKSGKNDMQFSLRSNQNLNTLSTVEMELLFNLSPGTMSKVQGVNLAPLINFQKSEDLLDSDKKPRTGFRDLDAMFNKLETYGIAGSRVLNNFLEVNPELKDLFQRTMSGGLQGGFFLTKPEFDAVITTLAVKQKTIKRSPEAYNSGKKLKKDFVKKSKQVDFNKNQDAKIDLLIDVFLAIETHLKDNPNDIWFFEEMLKDTGKHQDTLTRVLAPTRGYPVNSKGKPTLSLEVVEEHSFPQNLIGKALLWAAANGRVKEMSKVVKAAYMQMSLLKTDDNLINNAGFQTSMPFVFFDKILPRILDGSLDYLPSGLASVIRLTESGIDTSKYLITNSKPSQTIAQFFGVDGLDVTKANELIKQQLLGESTKEYAKEYTRSSNGIGLMNSLKYNKDLVMSKVIRNSKIAPKENKGISVFDFDETAGISDNFVIATKDGVTERISSDQWPNVGDKMLKAGWEMDFSDFNKVTNGRPGPLMQKLKNQIKKYGAKNVFILTARAPQSQKAIHDYLKSEGVNIPIANITGLGNSTGEAKADWMVDKLAEGYNDFYFVDDAMPNVTAVKDMLEQFDVKSKVVQARIQFSKRLDEGINEMLQINKGIKKEARFSAAEGRAQGIGKGKYKYWIPPGAEDFMGLLYTIASGKGKVGDQQIEFFREALLVPYNGGIMELNQAKQELSSNYKKLLKQHPDVKKRLQEKVAGTNFSVDHAIRVYLWDKAGFEIPGLAEGTKQKLLKTIQSDVNLQVFADNLGIISKSEKGYVEPGTDWVAESIIADLANVTDKIGRKQFLKTFSNNVDQIFSEENLNKIEAIYGRDYREALEDSIYRMKNGKNRSSGKDRQVGRWENWITNSVGAIMFLNMRSALLQTMSAINFVNWSDNNPIKAAAAFANQPQYWKDFSMIFNSPYLQQRRSGLKTDVNEAQLANALNGKKNKAKAAIAYLLKKGFTPTQIADSFAIASGGATFYRNRVNTYLKQGQSQTEAENQAMKDLQENANISQQSSDDSLISKQQASPLGRFILAFQNTPMQYARITKKAAIDLIKGRGDWKHNMSKILYYTFIQNLAFNAMQQALFALAFSDDDEDEKILDKKQTRLINGMVDSVLRGTGIYGAVVATAKNVVIEFWKQDQKGFKGDHAYTMLQFANISPPIGSKLRKLYTATQTRKFNKKEMKRAGWDITNPAVPAIGQAIEAFTNVPLGRATQKIMNVSEAFNEENESWQRIALMMGWNSYDLLERKKMKKNYKGSSKSSKKGKSKGKSK